MAGVRKLLQYDYHENEDDDDNEDNATEDVVLAPLEKTA